MSDAALFTTVREPLSPYSPHLTEAQKSESEFCEETVTKVATSRFPRLAKASAAVRNFYNETQVNYRVRQLLTFVAVYPIVKLILTLIAGAALTLTPANIVLIAAAALFLISLTIETIKSRNIYISCNCSNINKNLARNFVKNLFSFAIAPVTAPVILFRQVKKIASACASDSRTRKASES